jgi:hypothetical protein
MAVHNKNGGITACSNGGLPVLHPAWRAEHGESTAFCPVCNEELVLGDVYFTDANPVGTAGNQDLICPSLSSGE